MLCAIDFTNLHSILRSLYDEMMPLCSDMAGVAQGIAGLGALFYVAYRIWQSLARAEPVDVFPLLRPFAIGFCIMFFPTVVLGTINSVMSPIVQGTASMLEGQTLDMQKYREEKDRLEYEQMMKDPSTAYLVDDAEFDRQIDGLGVTEIGTAAGMYIERGMYKVKKAIQNFFRELLEMLFQAASLTIDTIRTFFLIVLAILGPIAFALSVWDGFQNTLVQWICRYIQTYLWLPVADLFSTILAAFACVCAVEVGECDKIRFIISQHFQGASEQCPLLTVIRCYVCAGSQSLGNNIIYFHILGTLGWCYPHSDFQPSLIGYYL